MTERRDTELGTTDRLTKALPNALVADPHDHRPIARRERLVRRDARMPVAEPFGGDAGGGSLLFLVSLIY